MPRKLCRRTCRRNVASPRARAGDLRPRLPGFAASRGSALRRFLASIARTRRVVGHCAPGGAVEILVLTALERPKKCCKAKSSEQQRNWNEPGQRRHVASSKVLLLSRTALAVTVTEDADIATAATRGVTSPAIASGTNTML